MRADAWTQWRAAEETLARTNDADASARKLSARHAWILRATAALEAGNRAALVSLCTTAPSPELGAVAEVALSDRDEIDPTRLRASLKKAGVPNEPLPRLDLVRLACVAHNRGRPSRPPSLAHAARDLPVLAGALAVLSNRFAANVATDDLLARSPRMASFWAAGVAQHDSTGDVRGAVVESDAGIDPLPLEPWPDLDDPVADPRKRSSLVSLAEFLRDPLAEPWSAACTQHATVLGTRGDRAQRLEAIGGLLDAIDTLVRQTRLPAAIPVVHAALDLVEASPEVRKREVLLNQLLLLDLRLRWSSGEGVSDDVLEPLWAGLQGHPAADRAQFARAILTRADGCPLPRAIQAEVLAAVVRSDADWEGEIVRAFLVYGRNVDMRAFHVALRGVPARERDLALGYMHAFRGSLVEALRSAARLFEHGASEDASRITMTAVASSDGAPPRGRQERRLRQRAMLELVRAADACAVPPGPELLVALFEVLGSMTEEILPKAQQVAELEELLATLLACARKRLDQPPTAQQPDLLGRLQLMTILGLDDEAQEAFRVFGRWLRRADPEESIPAALRVCAGLCPDEETILSYGLFEGGIEPAVTGATGATGATGDPRPAWLHSLTAWLDRESSEIVGRCAVSLARSVSVDPNALARWYLEVSDLEPTDEWDELDTLCDPDDEDSFTSLLNEFDEMLGGEFGPGDEVF